MRYRQNTLNSHTVTHAPSHLHPYIDHVLLTYTSY